MKVRSGFVSNSSSSSFVMFFSSNVRDKVYETLDETKKKIFDVMCTGPSKFFDKQVYAYSRSCDHGGYSHHDYELEEILRKIEFPNADADDFDEEAEMERYTNFSYNLEDIITKTAKELGEDIITDEWNM